MRLTSSPNSLCKTTIQKTADPAKSLRLGCIGVADMATKSGRQSTGLSTLIAASITHKGINTHSIGDAVISFPINLAFKHVNGYMSSRQANMYIYIYTYIYKEKEVEYASLELVLTSKSLVPAFARARAQSTCRNCSFFSSSTPRIKTYKRIYTNGYMSSTQLSQSHITRTFYFCWKKSSFFPKKAQKRKVSLKIPFHSKSIQTHMFRPYKFCTTK